MAIWYSERQGDGRIYRVEPEGEIEIDPEVMVLAKLIELDEEMNLDFEAIFFSLLHFSASWRVPAATILGQG